MCVYVRVCVRAFLGRGWTHAHVYAKCQGCSGVRCTLCGCLTVKSGCVCARVNASVRKRFKESLGHANAQEASKCEDNFLQEQEEGQVPMPASLQT